MPHPDRYPCTAPKPERSPSHFRRLDWVAVVASRTAWPDAITSRRPSAQACALPSVAQAGLSPASPRSAGVSTAVIPMASKLAGVLASRVTMRHRAEGLFTGSGRHHHLNRHHHDWTSLLPSTSGRSGRDANLTIASKSRPLCPVTLSALHDAEPPGRTDSSSPGQATRQTKPRAPTLSFACHRRRRGDNFAACRVRAFVPASLS